MTYVIGSLLWVVGLIVFFAIRYELRRRQGNFFVRALYAQHYRKYTDIPSGPITMNRMRNVPGPRELNTTPHPGPQ